MRRWAPDPDPFFIWLTPHAPHAEKGRSGGRCSGGAVPAPGDENLFANHPLPRPPSFNERKMGDKPEFMRKLPLLGAEDIGRLERGHGCRLASLREVDRGVEAIFDELRTAGALDETVVVFKSDNGAFEGEHRLKGGKRLPYSEAVEVPMAARFPSDVLGGPAVDRVGKPVANIDLAPTFLELAGADPCEAPADCRVMDGRSLVPLLDGSGNGWPSGRGLLLEMRNCRFRGIRARREVAVVHVSVPNKPTHTQGCRPDEQVEHYDLADDPFQLRNLARTRADLPQGLMDRLQGLRSCSGIEGRDPPPAPGESHCE